MIRDRWKDSEAKGLSGVDLLVHGSRLLGAEEDLVLHGGGNTSLKQVEKDHAGRSIHVMRVKGSGGDLKSIGVDGFPGVRLDELPALRRRKEMTDAEMVAYLGRCLVEPEARRPSIETLLHGFLPDTAIFHSHADSILALTNNPAPARHVRAALGDGFVLVPYRRPGFALSKLVAEYREAHPKATGAVLLNHGLFTWGSDVKTAYRRHIAAVRKAERYLARHRKARPFGALSKRSEGVLRHADALSPRLRGLLATPLRVVLCRDWMPESLEFSRSARAAEMCRIGPATPDHLLHTKRLPCFVPATDPSDPERTAKEAETAIREWSRSYERWVRKWNREGHAVDDLKPRVVIVRGLGVWAAGRDPAQASVIRSIYRHTIGIMAKAAGLGGFRSLSPREQFRAEYWELELYKRTLLPREKELSRRVAVITGAARGIGLGIAERFLAEGACVVLHDRDRARLVAACNELRRSSGARHRVFVLPGDVSSEEQISSLFKFACFQFGGVDIVVSNAGVAPAGAIDSLSLADWEKSMAVNATGHFLVAREAMKVMKAQGTGGAFVFVGSKNVPAPGKEFGAYSAGKAAETQLARVLALEGAPHGIRSNTLHPDAVFEDSGLWSPALRAERAKAQGIRAAEVPDFYRKRSLLGLEVRPRDVAEAALFFASDRSSRITGAWLPVDAGLKEAFPR
jgi:rhamnulose-1-phosphate aldolase/alcohol dehydrogenase